MNRPFRVTLRRARYLLFAAVSCTSMRASGAIERAPEAARRSCAFFTRRQDIAHLWIFPEGPGTYPSIEIGVRPGSDIPHQYTVYYQSGLGVEGDVPAWQRADSAYAHVYWPDTLVTADAGVLTLAASSRDRLSGRYTLRGRAGARRSAPGRAVQFRGSFDAMRDTAYERFVYRSASEFGRRAPRHRCAITPPT